MRPLIPIFLVFPYAACGGSLICGPGTFAEGGDCLPVDAGVPASCGPGTVASDGQCLPAGAGAPDASSFCGPGTRLVGLRCVPDFTCGPGTHPAGDLCVPDPVDAGFLQETTPWSANVHVAPAGFSSTAEPEVAVDSKGAIFVASMVDTTGMGGPPPSVALFKSTDQGKTFTTLLTQAPPASPGNVFYGDTTVLVDSADRVYWGWIEYTEGYASIGGDVYVAISSDGTAFGTPQQVNTPDPTNPLCDRPWLSREPGGAVFLSWTNGSGNVNTGGVLGARFAFSKDGKPFGAQETIFDPSGSQVQGFLEESPLAFDATGEPIAIRTDYQYSATTMAAATSVESLTLGAGGGWKASTVDALMSEEHFTFETYPLVTSDAKGNVTAVFLDGVSRVVTPFTARSTDGTTWSSPSQVLAEPVEGTAALPWITTDETGSVHLFWLDNRWGAWLPYTATSTDGLSFDAPERVGDALFVEDGSGKKWIGDFNSLVVRGGRRYAVWTDTREGVSQVYFATAPAQ